MPRHFEPVPFKVEHVDMLDMRPEDGLFLDFKEIPEHSYTFMCDGEPIACFGAVELWDGVWEVWTIGSKLINKYPIAYTKMMRHSLLELHRQYSPKRIQVCCLSTFKRSAKWLKRFKIKHNGRVYRFKYEGKMRKYFANKDYIRLGMV